MKLIIIFSLFCGFTFSQTSNIVLVKGLFINGTWQVENTESYEHWDYISSDQLKGFSYTIENGKMEISEYLELKSQKGKWTYVATVIGQNNGQGIIFTQVKSDSLLIFENLKHDFPKRIIYKKLSENEIQVSISDGKDKIISYKLNKQETKTMEKKKQEELEPKVTGIGGIFFFSENPSKVNEWYGENLGLAIDDYGSPFEFRNANRPEEINYLRWSPFKQNSEYFAPSKKEFMINYRVQNLEGLLVKLKANGVTILDEVETYDYGKFVHIMDLEGNKIELWEPIDHIFTSYGGETTK